MTVVTTLATPPVLGAIRCEERWLRNVREHRGSNDGVHDEADDGG